MYNEPLAYFFTFNTYGSWLHGDERKSIMVKDKTTLRISRNDAFHKHQSESMKYPVVNFEATQRKIVLDTILKHCYIKDWKLYAVHVRSNHVHVIVKTSSNPDEALGDLKAWATRKLREAGHNFDKVWGRHGSTKYIFTSEKT